MPCYTQSTKQLVAPRTHQVAQASPRLFVTYIDDLPSPTNPSCYTTCENLVPSLILCTSSHTAHLLL